jgi:hypothetical protein
MRYREQCQPLKAFNQTIYSIHSGRLHLGGVPGAERCLLPGQRVPVSVGRVRRDACRWPDSDARSRPVLG